MGQRGRHDQISGIVDLDDYYAGSPSNSGKHGRKTDRAAAAISKRETGAPSFIWEKAVDGFNGKNLQQTAGRCFAEQAGAVCGGYHSSRSTENAALRCSLYEAGDPHRLHTAISNFKALLLGTCHSRRVIRKTIWMSSPSASTAETQEISSFPSHQDCCYILCLAALCR